MSPSNLRPTPPPKPTIASVVWPSALGVSLWVTLGSLLPLAARAEVSEAFVDPFVDCSALESLNAEDGPGASEMGQAEGAVETGEVETREVETGEVEAEETIAPDPYRVEAQGDQARCQQNWDEALSYYREAMDIHRANRSDLAYAEVDLPLLYFKLAQVQAITDDLEGALASLQEAIGRDPLYGYLPPFSDRQYSPLGEPVTDGGLSGNPYAAPTTAQDPLAASAYFELGHILEQIGSPFAAIEAYEEAIVLSPQFAQAYNALGNVMVRSGVGDQDKAIEALDTALQIDPDLVWAHYNRGYALAWFGDAAAGFAAFRRVVDYHTGLETIGDPYKEAIAWRMVGDVYMDQGNASPAIEAYTQANTLDPDFAPGHIQLGEAFLMLGDTTQAIQELLTALDQLAESEVENRAEAYYHLGTAYWLSEQWELAREALLTARSLNPALAEDIQNTLDYINDRP